MSNEADRKQAEDMVLEALRHGIRPKAQNRAFSPATIDLAEHLFDTFGDWEWQTD